MSMNSRNDVDYIVLKQYGCTYLGPDYDPRTHVGPTPYCGSKDLVDGKLYCTHHYPMLFQVGTATRKRHKDIRRANAVRDLISDFDAVIQELEAEGFDVYAPTSTDQEEMV